MLKNVKGFGRQILNSPNKLHALRDLRVVNGILQLEKGNLEARIRDINTVLASKRSFLAEHFISGDGIEIGAAQLPVKVPSAAKVKYVDIFSAEELKKALPKYARLDIMKVDVVDDGEKLAKFKNNSLDFIIANHFIEHCVDPIGTIINMYKKLRPNGVLYMGIPDKRYTFDILRPVTSYSHLLEEHADKTNEKFRKEHTLEYVKLGDEKNSINPEERVEEILASGYRIHYHVWTQKEMTEMLSKIATDFKLDFEIEALLKNHHEVIYVLRKMAPHKPIDYTPQM